jgi:hypothetical protein
MKKCCLFYIQLLLFSYPLKSQFIHSYKLNENLREISGIELINDTLLVAHNDGGNDALLYVLNLTGNIIHTCKIYNANNRDWEDITKDNKGFLYIADIGNNSNKRKKLNLLRVSIASVLKNDSVYADIHTFSYADQTLFPPDANQLYYDAESISFLNDSLWLFTKCRTKPFDGKSLVYATNATDFKRLSFLKIGEYTPGRRGWLKDSFTGCTSINNLFYLITYKNLLILERKGNKFACIKRKSFKKINQREAIAVSNEFIFIANESNWLFGKQRLNIYRNE